MPRTRIKICGLTRAEDIAAAVAAGADALGFVFYPASKRYISPATAKTLLAAVPPCVTTVGLFVNPAASFVQHVLDEIPLDQVQFHGEENAAFCAQFGRRWMKAIPMRDLPTIAAVNTYLAQFPTANGLLFDAFGREKMGGSGQTFDWATLPPTKQATIIAGGLTADNVGAVITRFQPFAVDVSSGVESAPGIKSSAKMRAFIQAVEKADEYTPIS